MENENNLVEEYFKKVMELNHIKGKIKFQIADQFAKFERFYLEDDYPYETDPSETKKIMLPELIKPENAVLIDTDYFCNPEDKTIRSNYCYIYDLNLEDDKKLTIVVKVRLGNIVKLTGSVRKVILEDVNSWVYYPQLIAIEVSVGKEKTLNFSYFYEFNKKKLPKLKK